MTKGGTIAAVIVVALIFAFAFGLVTWMYLGDQAKLDQGCEPKAWNMYGSVSIWSCPVSQASD